jgi:hypothetical protein
MRYSHKSLEAVCLAINEAAGIPTVRGFIFGTYPFIGMDENVKRKKAEVIDRDPTAEEITKIVGMGYKQNTEDKRRFWALHHHMIDCAYGGYQLQILTNQSGGIRSITSGYVSAKDLYLQICNYRFDRPD